MIESVSFSGDGVAGFTQVGVLIKISEICNYKNFVNQIKEINGCSMGSIIGLLFSIGLDPKEMLRIIKNTFDFKNVFNPDIKNIFNGNGFDNGDTLSKYVKNILERTCGNGDITFEEHYNKYNNLYTVLVFNLTKVKFEYMNNINTPSMKIVDAIRMSTSIPLLFTSILYNDDEYIDPAIFRKVFKISNKKCLIILNKEKIIEDVEQSSSIPGYLLRITKILTSMVNIKEIDDISNGNIKIEVSTEGIGVDDISKLILHGYLVDINPKDLIEERSDG